MMAARTRARLLHGRKTDVGNANLPFAGVATHIRNVDAEGSRLTNKEMHLLPWCWCPVCIKDDGEEKSHWNETENVDEREA